MQEGKPQKGVIKRALKSMVNFPAWMGWSDIKYNAGLIRRMAKGLWTVSKPEHEETYEQAVKRMALTEEHLERRKRIFFCTACFYFFFALVLLAYTIYLLMVGTIMSVLMTFVLVLVIGSLAFREHFWYFQMYEKRLGCSLKDWVAFLFGVNRGQK